MTKSQPIFVLVGGAASPATWFDPVASALKAKGFDRILQRKLLSSGERAGHEPATTAEDAADLHDLLSSLVSKGNEVVLGANSYGSLVSQEAMKGLSWRQRQSKDLPGGIIAFVSIAGIIVRPGEHLMTILGAGSPEDQVLPPASETGYASPGEPEFWKSVFNDLSEAESLVHGREMIPQSIVSRYGTLTHEEYINIPLTYIHTTRDQVISPDKQLAMIETAKKAGSKVKVVTLDLGHVPMLSAPQEVAEILIQASRD